mmetsp:Transcript_5937/g.12987  ORF Transcript_5937/g.12987 Transcript_5937/m.12987 type:complete len:280 (-) Transcript_5937:853-1692(-)
MIRGNDAEEIPLHEALAHAIVQHPQKILSAALLFARKHLVLGQPVRFERGIFRESVLTTFERGVVREIDGRAPLAFDGDVVLEGDDDDPSFLDLGGGRRGRRTGSWRRRGGRNNALSRFLLGKIFRIDAATATVTVIATDRVGPLAEFLLRIEQQPVVAMVENLGRRPGSVAPKIGLARRGRAIPVVARRATHFFQPRQLRHRARVPWNFRRFFRWRVRRPGGRSQSEIVVEATIVPGAWHVALPIAESLGDVEEQAAPAIEDRTGRRPVSTPIIRAAR